MLNAVKSKAKKTTAEKTGWGVKNDELPTHSVAAERPKDSTKIVTTFDLK